MKKDATVNESSLFRTLFEDVKPLQQDKVRFTPKAKKKCELAKKDAEQQRAAIDAGFYFSDEFEPDLNTNGTVNYVSPGADRYLAKQLRRGDFNPELILDLHGMTKATAKLELAALIEACKKQHVQCACVVHGVSGGVLKHKVPHYLVQHPDILAIHQAPLEFGGKGALLVLINLKENVNPKYD